MDLFLYSILIISCGGIFSIFLPERFKSYLVATCCGIASVLTGYTSIDVLYSGAAFTHVTVLAQPFGEVRLMIDRLSAFFILVISLMSFIGTLYAAGYMKKYINTGRTVTSHFFFLSMLVVSMLLVPVIQNALAFLVVWEIMSLSSFFLVVFENEKEEVYKAGINYLISMHIGVLFIISAFLVLIIKSDSLDFASFIDVFDKDKSIVNIVFLLFFIGFGTKAGFMPFHTWLPRAHPAAPSHVSGLMSGIMIKTGIYGILRVILLIKEPTALMAYSVLFIALVSGILGVAYAIAQHNLKKLLAYHSVENIGIIGIGIGLGLLGVVYKNYFLAVLGFSGGILHVLNHSIFKSLLFYSAGGVYQATHQLEIEKLGGLIKPMLYSAVFFLVGSIAICGLPPFNGFVSELFIYLGIISGLKEGNMTLAVPLILAFSGLAFIGAMALLCFTKAFSVVFLGAPRSEYHEEPHEVSPVMKTAMVIQCILIVIIGLAPAHVFSVMQRIAGDFIPMDATGNLNSTFSMFNQITSGLFLFIALSLLIFLIRQALLKKRTVAVYKTWDCGYQAGNTRMQYTASSYAAPFIKIIKPVLNLHEDLKLPAGPFPDEAHYHSHVDDKIETSVIDRIIDNIQKFLQLFSWIQSGNTQQYILYGLVFLIVISLYMIGV
ncbi:MAG: hypothetical protein MUC95_02550 [Spirochaetes bacterium]|nr:hypothetical protein [Spirochaetota bacterium]